MPTKQVGLLHTGSRKVFGDLVDLAIKAANDWLKANGSDIEVKLQPVRTRYADDDLDQLEDYADFLIEKDSDIILAAGGPQSAIAARDATAEQDDDFTKRTSVVFTTVANPVDIGLRVRCEVPGETNLTGMAGKTSENDPVRLDFLHKVLAAQGLAGDEFVYGVLVNPSRQKNRQQFKELKRVAEGLKVSLIRKRVSKPAKIAKAFADFRSAGVAGVVVTADALFNNNRTKIIAEAAPDAATGRVGVPAIYQWKEFTDNFREGSGVEQNGGLISFGPSMTEAYQKAGEYIGRVAAETAPSDLECSQPQEGLIEVWVNERTARMLGFDLAKIPPQLGNKPVQRRP